MDQSVSVELSSWKQTCVNVAFAASGEWFHISATFDNAAAFENTPNDGEIRLQIVRNTGKVIQSKVYILLFFTRTHTHTHTTHTHTHTQ